MDVWSVEQMICQICSDEAKGMHYGVITCEGCKGFFKRVASMSKSPSYRCYFGRNCPLTPETRNNCKACRLQRCIDLGMVGKLSKKATFKGMLNDETQNPEESREPVEETMLNCLKSLSPGSTADSGANHQQYLESLQSTPSGLTLIRKVTNGKLKSSPDLLKQLMKDQLKNSQKSNDLKADRNEVDSKDKDNAGNNAVVFESNSSNVSSSASGSSPVERIEEGNPPIPDGNVLESLPPLPPLLHVPTISYDEPSLKRHYPYTGEFMNLGMLSNGQCKLVYQSEDKAIPIKKRRRNRSCKASSFVDRRSIIDPHSGRNPVPNSLGRVPTGRPDALYCHLYGTCFPPSVNGYISKPPMYFNSLNA